MRFPDLRGIPVTDPHRVPPVAENAWLRATPITLRIVQSNFAMIPRRGRAMPACPHPELEA